MSTTTQPVSLDRVPAMIHQALLCELRKHQHIFGTALPSSIEITIRFHPDGGRVNKVNIRPQYEFAVNSG